ncbi:lysozyme [Dokdonella fugitiva]|uniref:Lysozyme n=1 Tax=Dokdonella fugitiva TaxID=328517 RepID=A0A839EPA8_9GAMM|nr:lysozyme [Dokdonella fugitiva]MBA8886137.1 lysozyme [Dokdonella fugitiva]
MKQKLTAGVMSAVLAVASPCVMWFEGMVPHTYRDPVGIPTACYGHTGPDVTLGRSYSADECRRLLDGDLAEAYAAVAQCVRVPVEPYEAAAMVSFAFNAGGHAFCGSTMLRLVNAGADGAVFCQQLMRWTKATVPVIGVKVELPGLVKRRTAEREMCLGHDWKPTA